jgi:hypothetical protein
MTSWTAILEWSDLGSSQDEIAHWASALEGNSGVFQTAGETGVLSVALTLEASSLDEALQVSLKLVEGIIGREAQLRRIAVADDTPMVRVLSARQPPPGPSNHTTGSL